MRKNSGISGFVSFDFVLDRQGKAWLLECNSRIVGVALRGPQYGHDLIGSLISKVIQNVNAGEMSSAIHNYITDTTKPCVGPHLHQKEFGLRHQKEFGLRTVK